MWFPTFFQRRSESGLEHPRTDGRPRAERPIACLSVFLCCALILPFTPRVTQAAAPLRNAVATEEPAVSRPYTLQETLRRAEELFVQNNYREALIFYYEGLDQVEASEIRGKLHFRIGECLEGIRRFDFAAYHYKLAIKLNLGRGLMERAANKLKLLPRLAQKEEAMRLYQRAMTAYRKRNVRDAIDDYLKSLRLEPSLMAQDNSGLLDDAIQYLTLLSESKDQEPSRLLKLASLLELRGETEKAIETFKQILIIYPKSPQAREAEEKVAFFTSKRNSYLEFSRPANALSEVAEPATRVLFTSDFEFSDPGAVSKDFPEAAFTFKASNEQPNVPRGRFELFTVILGKGENQKEFFYKAEDGIPDQKLTWDDGTCIYQVAFEEVNATTAYIQDVYGEGSRPSPLFTRIKTSLVIQRKQ